MSLLPCIGLAEKIENTKAYTAEVKSYLKNILDFLLGRKVDMILAKIMDTKSL
ncbi:glutamate racemase 1 domain protein [Acinetobacter sp. 1578804]|nr:hypothetical protein ACINWC136_4022 [Acinetobacter pittii]EXB52427.1 glutamate racemase 1 domain protein [Acinetobacter baumannii 1440422]EXE82658.1 glutamate racemase 1 domain protein [Acinetobacter sp. 1578804]EXG30188.1 glutamate racemase 1 domain protein [Acinetobacter sp. 263903-2]EXR42940.1 glutamate racemase 1 domain protein [Acinetobacter sp. 1294243]KCX15749.1 glutamate racemase 1 domain protein [Acinetobacter sp. 1264765]